VVLEGTRALVTGGATGLGRAIVHALHQAGARVIWTDQREPEHPAHRMPADAPSFVRQDVRERADWERVADKCGLGLGGSMCW
jgi:NAD(P)-dependent dehydrogenase (short-subunit alcohol dehydrogenase family)